MLAREAGAPAAGISSPLKALKKARWKSAPSSMAAPASGRPRRAAPELVLAPEVGGEQLVGPVRADPDGGKGPAVGDGWVIITESQARAERIADVLRGASDGRQAKAALAAAD